MEVLLLVIQAGHANGEVQVCCVLRQSFHDWYMATAGQDAVRNLGRSTVEKDGKHILGTSWFCFPSNKRLQHYALQNRDYQLLCAACPPLWFNQRGALMQIKNRTADCGDVDALRWLFMFEQGISSVALERAVERNNLEMVQLIVEHVKSTNNGKDLGPCMHHIGTSGAKTNQWHYVEWMLDVWKPELEVVLKAARAGHADLLKRYLDRAGPQEICTQKLACYYSRQYPRIQALLRSLDWLCDCAFVATVLTKPYSLHSEQP
jgi:hypothetical protein